MSNPQGPSNNPADPPAWGQQPPGGWGRSESGTPADPAADDDRTQAVDPRAWQGQQPAQQGGWNGPAPAQQYPGQAPYPGQQPPHQGQQPYQGQPPYPGQQQPYAGQQQPYPGQQSWGQQPQQGAPQPTQQWVGQQGDGGAWGPGYPPLPDAPARSGRSKLPFILGGVGVLVVAAILVLGFVTPGFFLSKVFDTAAVQTGVQKVLTDSYNIQDVSGVTCGKNIAVTQGNTFTCDATIAGKPTKVNVRITSNDGNYEVVNPT